MNASLRTRILRASRRSRKLLALARSVRRQEQDERKVPGPPRCLSEKLRQAALEGEQ